MALVGVELVILAATLILLWITLDYLTFKHRAPGPQRLPVLGTLIQLALRKKDKPPFQVLQDLQRIHGPVMSLQMGQVYQLIVNDFQTMKEILISDLWVDRYFDAVMSGRSFGKALGIIFINGDTWKEMRRFSTRTLRDFGFGRQKSMEFVIGEEIDELKARLNKLRDTQENIINFKGFFTISVLNILWSMIAGHRFSYDDQKLHELLYFIDALSKGHLIGGNIIMAFPFLRFFLPKLTARGKKFTAMMGNIQQFFRNILEERRKQGHYNEVQNDFIEVFLHEIDKQQERGAMEGRGLGLGLGLDGNTNNYYTDEQFIIVIMDLFMAGSETTSNTLEYALLFMIINPEVQKKVQDEIDRVVGRGRNPTGDDRHLMPYTEATLLEVQRIANVIPIINRCPSQDTKIGPYDVPKGTMCLLNIYDWHMNEDQWPEPSKFNPDRFLDNNGQVINAHKILTFGLGKRVCLGEVLAKVSVFTYFTTLLQSYNFELSPNHPKPSQEPEPAFTLAPYAYHSCVTLRS